MQRSHQVPSSECCAAFLRDGYAIIPPVFSDTELQSLRTAVAEVPLSDAVRRKQSVYGMRNLFESCAVVQKLAAHPSVWQWASVFLNANAFAVRAAYFNKTRDTNWGLRWHQDRAICVQEQIETPGFRFWTERAGVWQVQPPAELLQQMVALRIHLDDCNETNGALRVIPGSHRHGFLDDHLEDWTRGTKSVTCSASAGGVVAMCPLILHASSRSETSTQRRVIHIEYATQPLPGELEWKWEVSATRC